jgi:hypothetical protein
MIAGRFDAPTLARLLGIQPCSPGWHRPGCRLAEPPLLTAAERAAAPRLNATQAAYPADQTLSSCSRPGRAHFRRPALSADETATYHHHPLHPAGRYLRLCASDPT